MSRVDLVECPGFCRSNRASQPLRLSGLVDGIASVRHQCAAGDDDRLVWQSHVDFFMRHPESMLHVNSQRLQELIVQ